MDMTQQPKGNFPNRGDEYWKFTNPASFLKTLQSLSEEHPQRTNVSAPLRNRAKSLQPISMPGISREISLENLFPEYIHHAVTLSGLKLKLPDSISELDSCFQIEPLSELREGGSKWFNSLSGELERSLQKPITRPFARYCIENAQCGYGLRVKQKCPEPMIIDYFGSNQSQSESLIYNAIKVDPHAELTLIEIGNTGNSSHHVTEIEVAEHGKLNHFRILAGHHQTSCLTHQYTRLAEDSSYLSFTFSGNNGIARNEYIIELGGDNGNAHISGIVAGYDQMHHDDTVFVNHRGLNCKSRQVFKKVLKDKAVGVFQGKILVDPGAQKTDGYQKSQALLLSEQSQFLVKPELEIYADDVSCSHGSTCGSIDKEALFYLCSRGIPKRQAIGLLAEGFLAEVFDEFDNNYVAGVMRELLSKSLIV